VAVSLQQISRKLICADGPFVLPSPLAKSFFAGALSTDLWPLSTLETRLLWLAAKTRFGVVGTGCKGNQSAFSTGSVVNRIAVSLQLQTW
jgi:hypothetical protein